MTKKLYYLITLSCIIVISVVAGLAWYFTTSGELNQFKDLADQQFVGKFVKIGNYTDPDRWSKTEKEFVRTNTNPNLTQRVYSYILHYGDFQSPRLTKEDATQFDVLVFYYQRDTVFSPWRVTDYNANTVRNTTWNKAIALAQAKDVSKIDSDNDVVINHLTPLTPEQIEDLKRIDESDKKNKEALKEKLSASPQRLYELCLEDIKEFDNVIQAAKDGKTSYSGKYGTVPVTLSQLSEYERQRQNQILQCEAGKP